jgi:hypothetical protein
VIDVGNTRTGVNTRIRVRVVMTFKRSNEH